MVPAEDGEAVLDDLVRAQDRAAVVAAVANAEALGVRAADEHAPGEELAQRAVAAAAAVDPAGLTGSILPPEAFQRSVSSSVRRARIEARTRQKDMEMSSEGYIQMIDLYEKNFDTQLRVFMKQLVDTARSSTKPMYERVKLLFLIRC